MNEVCELAKQILIELLDQLPDAANQELFGDCQLQVWAITSISELAIASYAEDVYGVVQRVSQLRVLYIMRFLGP